MIPESIVPVSNKTGVSDFQKCYNVDVYTAPGIVKFDSRFITTVDVVHNLALLARLFTYTSTHSHTRSRTNIGLRQHTYNHTIAHSLIVTHTHTYALNHHINTQTHVRTTYIFTQKYGYSIH